MTLPLEMPISSLDNLGAGWHACAILRDSVLGGQVTLERWLLGEATATDVTLVGPLA